jgi:hypothetical protein
MVAAFPGSTRPATADRAPKNRNCAFASLVVAAIAWGRAAAAWVRAAAACPGSIRFANADRPSDNNSNLSWSAVPAIARVSTAAAPDTPDAPRPSSAASVNARSSRCPSGVAVTRTDDLTHVERAFTAATTEFPADCGPQTTVRSYSSGERRHLPREGRPKAATARGSL